jgi:hypothetical protein
VLHHFTRPSDATAFVVRWLLQLLELVSSEELADVGRQVCLVLLQVL